MLIAARVRRLAGMGFEFESFYDRYTDECLAAGTVPVLPAEVAALLDVIVAYVETPTAH